MTDQTIIEAPARPSLARTIARNAVLVTLGQMALKGINFLFNVYVIRHLGDDRFGQYSTVLAFVGLFQIFAELGVTQYVMREVARDRSKAPGLFWNLISMRLALALIGIFGITAAAFLTGYSSTLVMAIFMYTITFFLAAFEAPLEAILTAYERLDVVAGIGVINQVVFVLLGSIFMLSGLGFIWLIVAALVAMIPQILTAIFLIRRNHIQLFPYRVDPRRWLPIIKAGIPFGFISLALTITFSVDTVMLSRLEPDRVVGWYNVAYNLERSLLFFFTGFSVSIVPSLTRTYVDDKASVERWYFRSVKVILLTTIPVAVGGMLLAYPLIHYLYTDQFLPAASAFQLIIWDVPVLMFAAFCGNMTTVVSAERSAAWIYGASAVANVAMNLYAIPRFSYLGASVTTVLTDLVAAALFYFLLKRKLNMPGMLLVGLRIGLASAVMGVVVWLARDLNLLVTVALGAVVYAIMVLLFRVLDRDEWDMILRLVRRKGRPQPAGEAP